jgi:hypoxanthine phosphoribosyltransferase
MKLEVPSWADIETYLMELARKISTKKLKIDALICIWRGGACPSRLLSDLLNKDIIYSIDVKYYESVQKQKEAPLITQSISGNLAGKHVLVCDDVSDSGNSLTVVKKYLEKQKCASITTTTIYIKPWTIFIPDFYVKKTDAWIVFPWERIETLEILTRKYSLEEKLSHDALKSKFLSLGFPKETIDFYFNVASQYVETM